MNSSTLCFKEICVAFKSYVKKLFLFKSREFITPIEFVILYFVRERKYVRFFLTIFGLTSLIIERLTAITVSAFPKHPIHPKQWMPFMDVP